MSFLSTKVLSAYNLQLKQKKLSNKRTNSKEKKEINHAKTKSAMAAIIHKAK
jgi:hypothetical protein